MERQSFTRGLKRSGPLGFVNLDKITEMPIIKPSSIITAKTSLICIISHSDKKVVRTERHPATTSGGAREFTEFKNSLVEMAKGEESRSLG